MKILVLGGNRFLGYFTVKKLLEKKHNITTLNRSGNKGLFPSSVEELKCDRNDEKKMLKSFEGREFDAVYDFSGYYPNQVRTIIDRFDTKQYIFTSSIAVYNNDQKMPLREDSKAEGKNAFGQYGIDKAKCEELIKKSEINYTLLRPTYIYGPKDYTERMRQIFRIILNGDVVTIPSSNPKTQLVYVQDAADAFVSCLGNKKAIGQAYNICQEEIVSYGELVELIGPLTGKKPIVSFSKINDFPYEDWEFYCDISKSKKELGIKYTPLKQGLRETWEFDKEKIQ